MIAKTAKNRNMMPPINVTLILDEKSIDRLEFGPKFCEKYRGSG